MSEKEESQLNDSSRIYLSHFLLKIYPKKFDHRKNIRMQGDSRCFVSSFNVEKYQKFFPHFQLWNSPTVPCLVPLFSSSNIFPSFLLLPSGVFPRASGVLPPHRRQQQHQQLPPHQAQLVNKTNSNKKKTAGITNRKAGRAKVKVGTTTTTAAAGAAATTTAVSTAAVAK